MPETFSSEIGDAHERSGKRRTFSNDFRGASDSLIRRQERPQPIAPRRRWGAVVLVVVLVVGVLGGGGWALWYGWEPLSEWVAGLARQVEDDSEDQGEAEAPAVDEASTGESGEEPEPVFGVKGVPDLPPDQAGDQAGEQAPAEASGGTGGEPAAADGGSSPASPRTAKVEIVSTDLRGRASRSSITARLKPVDAALERCWAEAAGTEVRELELELRFRIRWNRRAVSIGVSGADVPDSVRECVREAMPISRWPEPRDLGDVSVTRRWKLRVE